MKAWICAVAMLGVAVAQPAFAQSYSDRFEKIQATMEKASGHMDAYETAQGSAQICSALVKANQALNDAQWDIIRLSGDMKRAGNSDYNEVISNLEDMGDAIVRIKESILPDLQSNGCDY